MALSEKVMCKDCEFDQGPGKCYFGIIKFAEDEPACCVNYMVKGCCMLCKLHRKENRFECALTGDIVGSYSKKCSEYIEIDSPADFRR